MATNLFPREALQARHLTSGSFNLASVIKVANSTGTDANGHGWSNRSLDQVLNGLKSRLDVISVSTGSLESADAAQVAAIDKIELRVGLAANGDLHPWPNACEYIGSQATVHSASIVLDARVKEAASKVGLGYSGGFQLPSWSSTNMLRNGGSGETSVIAGINRLDEMAAPLASPALSGAPTAPTPANNDDSTKIATTAFVMREVSELIEGAPGALQTLDNLAAALGDDANYATTITNALALKATIADPVFTGNPQAPTPAVNDNDTSIATTAYVVAEIGDRFAGGAAHGFKAVRTAPGSFHVQFGNTSGNPKLRFEKDGSDYKLFVEQV